MYGIEIALHTLMAIVMTLIFQGCLGSKSARKRIPGYFALLSLFDVIMLLACVFELYFLQKSMDGKSWAVIFSQIFSCLDFLSYFSILAIFVMYIESLVSQRKSVSWIFAKIAVLVSVIYAVLWCISVFNGMFFYVEDGIYRNGKYYIFGQMGGYVVLLIVISFLVYYRGAIGPRAFLVLFSFVIFPVIAVVVRPFIHFFSIQIALSLSIILIFDFIYMYQIRLIGEQEAKIAEGKIALMISQIRPHFVFNVLNSIYVLCDKDPKAGREAIGNFSNYLRGNIYAAEKLNEVSFDTELMHLQYYLNLEKMRFQDDVKFELDIKERDFNIPPMILQPIVENAVRHGVCKKKNGGVVKISSSRAENFIVIKIADDGVGFDTKSISSDDKIHIGINNVKERLWMMCGGELDIHSEIGKGTEVEIRIPLKRDKK